MTSPNQPTTVVDEVESVLQLRRHDDRTRDGEAEVAARLADEADEEHETLDLLAGEDGQRLLVAQLLLAVGVPLVGELLHEGVGHLQDLLLAGEAARAAGTAGLDVEDGREHLLRLARAEGDVGVAVHAESLGRVDVGVRLGDELTVLDDVIMQRDAVLVGAVLAVVGVAVARRDDLAIVEHLRNRGEEVAVLVVGDAAAVLDVRHHVADRLPRDGALLDVLADERQVVLEELH
jgi:hypothetical protein